MRISRLKGVSIATALCLAAVMAAAPSARAEIALPPPALGVGPASAWPAVTVIAIAGVLVNYDLIRRFTCSGDFLRLGGPGFTGPIGRSANVKPPPACAPR
ncbi:hypothetical protein [Phreatobacter sp.]|uniref:hypothetical protein n=1 Tax=Phreatobacter sp. TaxID=1966341 RepID=UPI003F6F834A